MKALLIKKACIAIKKEYVIRVTINNKLTSMNHIKNKSTQKNKNRKIKNSMHPQEFQTLLALILFDLIYLA